MKERLILQAQLKEIIPFSRTTLWRLEKKGKFPKRRQVSPGRIGWLASEVEAFLTKLPVAQGLSPKEDRLTLNIVPSPSQSII